MPSGLPSNLLSNIQHHLTDIHHHFTDIHHTITTVILYLEIPSWNEYSQSLSETYQHTLAATKSSYKLWILTFRPFIILLGLLAGCTIQVLEYIGHYTLIVLKFVGRHTVHHGYLSLKAGYQQAKTASIWFVNVQRNLSPAAIGVEVGVMVGIGLLWWMRRYIKRKRYVERVGRWYGSKKRMVLRRYNNAIHQISQTSLFLAMLLPHVLYVCFITTIKYFVPKVVTYIATQTYTSGFISVLWPLGKTVLLVHRYRGVKIKVDERRREEEEERKRREEKEKSSKNGGKDGGAGTSGLSWASSMAGSLFGSGGGGGNNKKAKEEQKSKNSSSAVSPQKVGTKMGAAASAASSSWSAKKTATGGAPTAKQSKLAQRYLRAAATETENNLSSAPSSLKAGGPLVSKGMKKKIDNGKNNSNNGTTDSNTKKEDDSSNLTEYPEESLLSLDEELVQIQEEAIELLRYWIVYALLFGIFHFVYLLPVVGRIVSNAGRVPTIDPPKFMKSSGNNNNKGFLSGFTLALSYQFLEEVRLAFFVWLCLLPTSLTVPGTGGGGSGGGGGGVVDSGSSGGGVKARTAAFEKAAAAVVGVNKFKKKTKAMLGKQKSLMATYQNRPIDILYNRLTPVAISMVQSSNTAVTVAQQRASSSAANDDNNGNNDSGNTGGNVLGKITSTLTSFLDLAVLVRLISKETKQKIVTIVMESSSLLPSAITLVMPSYFTQYGILYANAMVPSANSSLVVNELQKKCSNDQEDNEDNINDDNYYALLGGMMRYLQYWTLHTLLSYILTSFSSLLAWVPFSTHITLLLWMFVLLERTTLLWYGILEAELIAFGVLHPHEGTKDGGEGGGGMDLEKTVTVRLLKRLGSSLPTGVVESNKEGEEKEEGSSKKDGVEVVGSKNEKGGGGEKRLSVVAEQQAGGGEAGKEGKINDDMDDGGRTDGPISEKKLTAAAEDDDNGQNCMEEEKKMTVKAPINADDDTKIITSEATPSMAVGESSGDDDAVETKNGEHSLAVEGGRPLLKGEEEEEMTKKALSVQVDVPKIPMAEASSSSMGVVENHDDAAATNSTNEVVTSGRTQTSDGDTAQAKREDEKVGATISEEENVEKKEGR